MSKENKPDIEIVAQASMSPHDAAALVKVTKKGLAEVIEILKRLKTLGYEVQVIGKQSTTVQDRIIPIMGRCPMKGYYFLSGEPAEDIEDVIMLVVKG